MSLDVYANMNERQREAIAHLEGPLLVVAGAGSGKTRVITHRIANIIQRGTRPSDILAITFTNKAAGEMQERVEHLLHLSTPWITTFHSAGLRLLKQEHEHLPFEHPFTIIDTDDQKEYMKRVLKDMKVDPKELKPRDFLEQISRWKSRLLLPEEVDERGVGDERYLDAYRRYRDMTREECRADFDDLLMLTVRLFDEHPDVLAKYQEKFSYILIDEYQDTNLAQYRMVRLLGDHGNVCATGDPDQAIYGWRGADISNIMNFERDFPGCHTVLLEENYRSTKYILQAAQGVIEHNVNRKDKTIFTNNLQGRKVRMITVDDQEDEAMAVAAACKRLHEDGTPYSDMAIFYRVNAQSRALEHWLVRRQLPYRIIGGTRFYDHTEVRDLIAYLNLLINPRDLVSFRRIVNKPRRGIGDRTFDMLCEVAEDAGVGALEVLRDEALLDRVAVGRARGPMRDMARLWRMLLAVDQDRAGDAVAEVLALSRLEEFYHGEGEQDEKAFERVQNLREVVTAATQYSQNEPTGGLNGFLDHIALLTAVDNRLHQEDDALILMTLHASKGLEFPVVFIVGCEQGLLPLVRDPTSVDYEEERRLMYVGITRAQQELLLSRAVLRFQFNQVRRNPPSMFLAELPDDCIEHYDRSTTASSSVADRFREGPAYPESSQAATVVRGRSVSDTPETLRASGLLTSGAALKQALGSGRTATGAIPRKRAPSGSRLNEAEPDDPFQAGQRVMHRVFGGGTVTELLGTGDRRRIHVTFDSAGPKVMSLVHVLDKMRVIG